jgi:hypothetical protein
MQKIRKQTINNTNQASYSLSLVFQKRMSYSGHKRSVIIPLPLSFLEESFARRWKMKVKMEVVKAGSL